MGAVATERCQEKERAGRRAHHHFVPQAGPALAATTTRGSVEIKLKYGTRGLGHLPAGLRLPALPINQSRSSFIFPITDV